MGSTRSKLFTFVVLSLLLVILSNCYASVLKIGSPRMGLTLTQAFLKYDSLNVAPDIDRDVKVTVVQEELEFEKTNKWPEKDSRPLYWKVENMD